MPQETGPSTERLVVVVSGGPGPLDPLLGAQVVVETGAAADVVVVAVDSGVDHALALSLAVDHVVGDLDSVSPGGLIAAEAAGALVHRHEADKDATDLDLGLELAASLDPDDV